MGSHQSPLVGRQWCHTTLVRWCSCAASVANFCHPWLTWRGSRSHSSVPGLKTQSFPIWGVETQGAMWPCAMLMPLMISSAICGCLCFTISMQPAQTAPTIIIPRCHNSSEIRYANRFSCDTCCLHPFLFCRAALSLCIV